MPNPRTVFAPGRALRRQLLPWAVPVRLFGWALALALLTVTDAAAQTPGSETHEVGPGDSLYGIVAVHYPDRMARWTDVAADLVALNPEAFPNGLDTVLKLGDVLVLVDYSAPDTGAASPDGRSAGDDSGTAIPDESRDTPEDAFEDDATTDAEASETGEDARSAADAVIGVVVAVESRALATDQQNQQRALTTGDPVLFGDAISTSDLATVTVRMLDDTEIRLMPGSRLMFERYRYDVDAQKGSAIMTLVKGGVHAISGLLGQYQPESMTINTAVATVGVRGTEFALRVCAGETCRTTQDSDPLAPGLYSGVIEGRIVLSNNTGDVENLRGEFYYVAAPSRVPEAAPQAARLLFSTQELARLDVEVEDEQPLSFLAWLKRKLFGN